MPNTIPKNIILDDLIDFDYVVESLKGSYGDKIAEHWQLVLNAQGKFAEEIYKKIYENATSAYLSLMDGKIKEARDSLGIVSAQCDEHNRDLASFTEVLRLELSGAQK